MEEQLGQEIETQDTAKFNFRQKSSSQNRTPKEWLENKKKAKIVWHHRSQLRKVLQKEEQIIYVNCCGNQMKLEISTSSQDRLTGTRFTFPLDTPNKLEKSM